MRQHTVTVYQFDELSETAKEKAREWYRDGAFDYDWWDYTYEYAATIAELFGLDIRQTRKQRMNGEFYYDISIQFSGFWSQGDGACFDGQYSYKPGALQAVRNYAPEDAELHRIVASLQAVQRRYFYRLTASCTPHGRYNDMRVSVELPDDIANNPDQQKWAAAEQTVEDCLKDFADWIYRALEREYDWLNNDEQVDESIRCNGYEFTEEGGIL